MAKLELYIEQRKGNIILGSPIEIGYIDIYTAPLTNKDINNIISSLNDTIKKLQDINLSLGVKNA